jgi:hypothetical protein
MAGSISSWPRLLSQCLAHLSPSGWVELIDGSWATSDDDSFPDDSAYAEFQRRLEEASSRFGKKINIAARHREMLAEAGFEGVVEVVKKVSSRISPV